MVPARFRFPVARKRIESGEMRVCLIAACLWGRRNERTVQRIEGRERSAFRYVYTAISALHGHRQGVGINVEEPAAKAENVDWKPGQGQISQDYLRGHCRATIRDQQISTHCRFEEQTSAVTYSPWISPVRLAAIHL
jgi:hypothetical protein